MKKPLIGITPAFYHHEELDRSVIAVNYTNRIQEAGGVPVIVPPLLDEEQVSVLLDRLDGFILGGGRDIQPQRYSGKQSEYITRPQLDARDRSDFMLADALWKRRIPTLGICLGLQEMNVSLGGDVYQDIPTEVPTAIVHKIGDMFTARHMVRVEAATRLSSSIGLLEVGTNSAHHQAVKTLASELVAVAWTEDGIIEGAEARDPRIPFMAVQWHPEMETDPEVGLNLFRWLVVRSLSS